MDEKLKSRFEKVLEHDAGTIKERKDDLGPLFPNQRIITAKMMAGVLTELLVTVASLKPVSGNSRSSRGHRGVITTPHRCRRQVYPLE